MKMAARVKPILTVTMMNQMSPLMFADAAVAIRRRVMAKAVLLQAAAQIDQKPVMYMMKRVLGQSGLVMSISQLCLPKPIVVEMEPKMQEMRMVI